MKGFKATDSKGKCRGMEFKVGKSYVIKGDLKLCENGFHFCQNLFDVYGYYEKSENTRLFEIEAVGEIVTEGDKSATSKIKILRELTDKELLKAWINRTNSGNWNSGNRNSGNWNSGNRNSGDWNSGNRNSGDGNSGNRNSGDGNSGNRNSGNRNSGYGNSGDGNSGNRNSGDWNSGYGNSGNRNSGDWNSGDGNSGYFNTVIPVYFFNKPSDLVYTKDFENQIRSLNVKPVVTYVDANNMTEKEKLENPSYKVTGGFLRKTDRYNWSYLSESDKEFIKKLPNYDDDIFEKISGLRLLKPKTIKITVNGIEKELTYEQAKLAGLVD